MFLAFVRHQRSYETPSFFFSLPSLEFPRSKQTDAGEADCFHQSLHLISFPLPRTRLQ